jgi:hypothetical protein
MNTLKMLECGGSPKMADMPKDNKSGHVRRGSWFQTLEIPMNSRRIRRTCSFVLEASQVHTSFRESS